jgi:uncharacterized protein (DUF1330 family)
MPAYYIGEHKITDAAVFEEYLAKVMPMIERFGVAISPSVIATRFSKATGNPIGW